MSVCPAAIRWNTLGNPRYWIELHDSIIEIEQPSRFLLAFNWQDGAIVRARQADGHGAIAVEQDGRQVAAVVPVHLSGQERISVRRDGVHIAQVQLAGERLSLVCTLLFGMAGQSFRLLSCDNRRLCYWQVSSCEWRRPGLRMLLSGYVDPELLPIALAIAASTQLEKKLVDAR